VQRNTAVAAAVLYTATENCQCPGEMVRVCKGSRRRCLRGMGPMSAKAAKEVECVKIRVKVWGLMSLKVSMFRRFGLEFSEIYTYCLCPLHCTTVQSISLTVLTISALSKLASHHSCTELQPLQKRSVGKREGTLVDTQVDPIVAADTAVQKERAWSYAIADKGI
jgi:hypothetical protein